MTPTRSCRIFLSAAQVTHHLGLVLGQSLAAGSVLLLQGELGSGKTTLVQGLAEGLGIAEPIVSPTFNLINEYLTGRLPLYHIDLYRLQPPEVAALHPEIYWEGVEIPLGIVAIEWPERLQNYPPNYLQIHLSYQTDDGRQAELIPVGNFNLTSLDLYFQDRL
ncbi:MAG TPA: tRNA (adenosine(37)-N6)-threonylcarbamoyltransferase complex ATPase subunit type 1 TsaE [Candidatus Caenarcaniphilales bacterium]